MRRTRLVLRPSDFGEFELHNNCAILLRRKAAESSETTRERKRVENEAAQTGGGDGAPGLTNMQRGNQFENQVIKCLREQLGVDAVITPPCRDLGCPSMNNCSSLQALEGFVLEAQKKSAGGGTERYYEQVHVRPPADVSLLGLAGGAESGLVLSAGYADLIRIAGGGDGTVTVEIIDIKYSKCAKVSHERQIALYALYLQQTLSPAVLSAITTWSGSVWLPTAHPSRHVPISGGSTQTESLTGVAILVHSVPFDISARMQDVSAFVSATLPGVLAVPTTASRVAGGEWDTFYGDIEDAWAYTPSCGLCPYTDSCTAMAELRGASPRRDLPPAFVAPHHPQVAPVGPRRPTRGWEALFALTIVDAATGREWPVDLAVLAVADQQKAYDGAILSIHLAFPDPNDPPRIFALPGDEEKLRRALAQRAELKWQCLVTTALAKRQLVQLLQLIDCPAREHWREALESMPLEVPTVNWKPQVLKDNMFVFSDLFNALFSFAWCGWGASKAPVALMVRIMLRRRELDPPADAHCVSPSELLSASAGLLELPLEAVLFLWGRSGRSTAECAKSSNYLKARAAAAGDRDQAQEFLAHLLLYAHQEQLTDNWTHSYTAAAVATVGDQTAARGARTKADKAFSYVIGGVADLVANNTFMSGACHGKKAITISCTVVYPRAADSQVPVTHFGGKLSIPIDGGPSKAAPTLSVGWDLRIPSGTDILLLPCGEYMGRLADMARDFAGLASGTRFTLLPYLLPHTRGFTTAEATRPLTHDLPATIKDRFRVGGFEASHEQKEALAHVCSDAPVSVVWGPPGTGKTATTASVMEALIAMNPQRRILVTATTNNALTVMEEALRSGGSATVCNLQDDKQLHKRSCSQVVLGTFYKIFSKLVKEPGSWEPFDYLVIDEASMYPVPMATLVGQLLFAEQHKIILAGDLLQLQCIVPDVAQGCRVKDRRWEHLCGSILQALFAGAGHEPLPCLSELCPHIRRNGLPSHVVQLRRSFRSVPSLVSLIACLYPTGLVAHRVESSGGVAQTSIYVCTVPRGQSETSVVAGIIANELETAQQPPVIFACCPHRKQRALISEAVRRHPPSTGKPPRVDTTECFQGAECDVAVLCYAEGVKETTDFGFQLFRMNVAMSRARQKVILVLDEAKYALLKHQPRGATPFYSAPGDRSMALEGWSLLQEIVRRGEVLKRDGRGGG